MSLLALEAAAKFVLVFYLNLGKNNTSEPFSNTTECMEA